MKARAQGGGLYRAGNTFWERPWIGGRRTWRKVEAPNLKRAREILAARRTDAARAVAGLGRDPYGPGPITCGELFCLWETAGCPTRRFQPRVGRQLDQAKSFLTALRSYWTARQAEKLATADCLAYWKARQKHIRRGHGGRAVDIEISQLRSILDWSVASGKLCRNPLTGPIPKFRGKIIRHSRDCAPRDAGELHGLARFFFEDPPRQVLGWQIVLTALTGCRTSEILRCRWDAIPQHPGHITGEWLWLARSKGGVNPYALIHPALKQAIQALRQWCSEHYPENPWWFPSPITRGGRVDEGWLKHTLPAAAQVICERHITPHGLRAYYVTTRRSQGISDAQIAAEIGDATGAAIIASTYGAIPPNWSTTGAPKLGWIPPKPDKPAWSIFRPPARNIICLRATAGSKLD